MVVSSFNETVSFTISQKSKSIGEDISSTNTLTWPKLQTPSVKLGSNNATCLIQKHPVSYFFQNAGIYMDNLRFCPEIKALDSNDKSTLIELNHHEFGLFSHKYYAWLAKTSFSSAFMGK